jgi:hypothetical protein
LCRRISPGLILRKRDELLEHFFTGTSLLTATLPIESRSDTAIKSRAGSYPSLLYRLGAIVIALHEKNYIARLKVSNYDCSAGRYAQQLNLPLGKFAFRSRKSGARNASSTGTFCPTTVMGTSFSQTTAQ